MPSLVHAPPSPASPAPSLPSVTKPQDESFAAVGLEDPSPTDLPLGGSRATTARRNSITGFAYVAGMCAALGMLALAGGLVRTALEAMLVALAVALSSTSTVLATLLQRELVDTLYGKTVIEVQRN